MAFGGSNDWNHHFGETRWTLNELELRNVKSQTACRSQPTTSSPFSCKLSGGIKCCKHHDFELQSKTTKCRGAGGNLICIQALDVPQFHKATHLTTWSSASWTRVSLISINTPKTTVQEVLICWNMLELLELFYVLNPNAVFNQWKYGCFSHPYYGSMFPSDDIYIVLGKGYPFLLGWFIAGCRATSKGKHGKLSPWGPRPLYLRWLKQFEYRWNMVKYPSK